MRGMTVEDTDFRDLSQVYANFMGERRRLVDAIAGEYRAGASAASIAHRVSPAFGRDVVTEFCAEIRLYDSARKAMDEAGLRGQVSLTPPAIDAPREVRVNLAADPADLSPDAYAALPDRIRAALRDFQITLAPTADTDDGGPVDATLLDGDAARLVRLAPRT